MAIGLQAISALAGFRRKPVRSVAKTPDWLSAPIAAKDAQDIGLAEERRKDRANRKKIRKLEIRNRLAWSNSRLEYLDQQGKPFFRPEQGHAPDQVSRPFYSPIPIYAEPDAGGYPFNPAVYFEKTEKRFEQDPLFGWGINPLIDWSMDLGSNIPISAFPREMFPERPSTLRTQIAQDAIRFMSRAWYETMPQYSGCIGHFCDYIVGSGIVFDVVSDQDKQLSQDVADYLTTFATYKWNNLEERVEASALNLFRDGEDSLRLYPDEEFPQIRSVDTSTIRGPHNEINGPWAYGVLTSWPRDYEDVRAYHIWYADNTKEPVSPNVMKLCKLDTTGPNVKRGVPLAYKIRKQLPQIANLVDCMAIGEAARQSIPYIVQYNLADKSTVGAALRASEVPQDVFGHHREDIEPGVAHHINKGQQFMPPPDGPGFAASGSSVYRTLCESCACATRTPIWFWTGSADAENYASSLVSESPVVKAIMRYQRKLTAYYKSMLEAAVLMAASYGIFPADVLQYVRIHVELPSPVARNRKDEIETDIRLLDKRLLSPQHLCKRNDLDFAEETDLTEEAEVDGWKNELGVAPGERPDQDIGTAEDEAEEKPDTEKWREQWRTGFKAGMATRFESWDESKHPRGQPDNAGEFGPGGAGTEETEETEDEPTKRPAIARGGSQPARREGKGKDARVVLADGSDAPSHITPAMIPPAWQDVQVFTDPDSEIYVKAKDAKGQSKTVYKPSYEAHQQAAKYVRIETMLAEAPHINEQIQSARADAKTVDAADCAWLINEQATRPGSEADTKGLAEYYGREMSADNVVITKGKGADKVALKFGDKTIPVKDAGTAAEIQRRMAAGESLEDSTFWLKSHGATTLEGRHVVESPDGVRLQFVGKEGVWHDHLIGNEKLAGMLTERKAKGEREKLFGVSDSQLSTFVKGLDHGRFSPKDFRTKRANELAVEEIQKASPPKSEDERKSSIRKVAEVVSSKLGNRWQQAIESYISPTVWRAWA